MSYLTYFAESVIAEHQKEIAANIERYHHLRAVRHRRQRNWPWRRNASDALIAVRPTITRATAEGLPKVST